MLVVAHAHINKAVLASVAGIGLARIHEVPQDNGCVNVLDYHPATSEWVVHSVNTSAPAASGSTSL